MEDLWRLRRLTRIESVRDRWRRTIRSTLHLRVRASSRACLRWPACPSLSPLMSRSLPPRLRWFGDRRPLRLARRMLPVPRRMLSRWRSRRRWCATALPRRLGTSCSLLLLPASMRIETRLWWPSRVISAPAFLSIVTGVEPPCALWVRPRSEMVGGTVRLSRHRRRSRQPCDLLTLEVRRGARLKLAAPVTSNRGWIVANAQRVVAVDTMAWSCSSLASSRLSSL